jgi:uncharacterized protein
MNLPSGPNNPDDPRFPVERAVESGSDPDKNSVAANSSSQSSDPLPPSGAILSYESTANRAGPPRAGYREEVGSETQPIDVGSNRFLDPDLRVPWGWLDLLLLVIVYIGATAISTILLAILFLSQGVAFAQIQHSPRSLGFFVVIDQVIVSLLVLLYLWVQARVRFNAPFWATLGWRKLTPRGHPRLMTYLGFIAFGCCLAASVQLVSAAFPAKGKLPIENFLQNRQAALALMVMSVVLAPVVEETIFRGYIYPVVARSFGVAAAVIGTGTLFGLLHAEQLWGGWAQIVLLVAVGIVFTWVRAAKRTVLASYLLHASYNSFLFLAFLFSSQGFRSLPR